MSDIIYHKEESLCSFEKVSLDCKSEPSTTKYEAIIYKDICVTGKKLSLWKNVKHRFKSLISLKTHDSNKLTKPKELVHEDFLKETKRRNSIHKLEKLESNEKNMPCHSLWSRTYQVMHFNTVPCNKINSKSCHKNYEISRFKCLRLPVIDFPENDQINATTSVTEILKPRFPESCIKNISKASKSKRQNSCNTDNVESKFAQVQTQSNYKYTKQCPYSSRKNCTNKNYTLTKLKDDKILKNNQHKKSKHKQCCEIDGIKFNKKSNCTKRKQNISNVATKNKLQLCSDKDMTSNKIYKSKSCKTQIRNDKEYKYNTEDIPVHTKTCLVPKNIQHESCQCSFNKYQKPCGCYNRNAILNKSGYLHHAKSISQVSQSDQLLTKQRTCPICNQNNKNRSIRKQTRKHCKVVRSDLNICQKSQQNYNLCTCNHPGCMKKQSGDGVIHFNKPSKDGYSIANKNKLKGIRMYPTANYNNKGVTIRHQKRACEMLPKKYHKSCICKERAHIRIPIKPCICNKVKNNASLINQWAERQRRKLCLENYTNSCQLLYENPECEAVRKKCIYDNLKCFYCKCKNKCSRIRRYRNKDYNCNEIFYQTIRRKPSIYQMCPWINPECLDVCCMWKQCTQMMCFCCAFLIWCPCILCFELCRLCFCSFCYE